MGARIAAFLAERGLNVLLLDLPTANDRNFLAKQALLNLRIVKPTAVANLEVLNNIVPGNFEDDLSHLEQCDWIIEAIAERFEWKENLYQRIAPCLGSHAILTSNTGGLSIHKLAATLPAALQARFLGVHFFNPPSVMKLVELIPHNGTDPKLIDRLKIFLQEVLSKTTIVAKDTPNFIGNRIGIFALLSAVWHAEALGIPPDTVDCLTGALLGRPNSATFRTIDLMGLDTFLQVVTTVKKECPDDPFNQYYHLPAWMVGLVDKGCLGHKTKKGIYMREEGKILVFQPQEDRYRIAINKMPSDVPPVLSMEGEAWFSALARGLSKEAKFVQALLSDLFTYVTVLNPIIAYQPTDIDQALTLGFGWLIGPFELMERFGKEKVNLWLTKRSNLCTESIR